MAERHRHLGSPVARRRRQHILEPELCRRFYPRAGDCVTLAGSAGGSRRVFTTARLLWRLRLPQVRVAHGSAQLLGLWLAVAIFADAQGVIVAAAGCLDRHSAGVSVKERDDLDHVSAVLLDGLGAP